MSYATPRAEPELNFRLVFVGDKNAMFYVIAVLYNVFNYNWWCKSVCSYVQVVAKTWWVRGEGEEKFAATILKAGWPVRFKASVSHTFVTHRAPCFVQTWILMKNNVIWQLLIHKSYLIEILATGILILNFRSCVKSILSEHFWIWNIFVCIVELYVKCQSQQISPQLSQPQQPPPPLA